MNIFSDLMLRFLITLYYRESRMNIFSNLMFGFSNYLAFREFTNRESRMNI